MTPPKIVLFLLGLLLAAMLFDLIGRKFGGRLASFLRATYYLPQILPVAIAAIVIGCVLLVLSPLIKRWTHGVT